MKTKHIYRFIGIIGFFVILSRVDIWTIISVIRHIHMEMLLVIALCSLSISVCKAFRWKQLLRLYGVKCKIKNVLIAYFMGTFLGVITPARIGDVSRVYYLKKISNPDISSGQLFSNIIADRIFDLLVVLIVALLGNAYFFSKYFFILVISFSLLSLGVILLYKIRHKIISPIRKILERLETLFPKISLQFHFDEIIKGLRALRTWRIIYPSIINIISFGVFYVTLMIIASVLGINISFLYLMVGMSTAMLFSVLPITIAGVGVRDAVLIFYFSAVGISNEVTISFSFLYLLFCLVLPGVMGSFPYLFHPEDLKKALSKVENKEDLI